MNVPVFISGIILFGICWGCWAAVSYLMTVYDKGNEEE
jgi:hypothetical protein